MNPESNYHYEENYNSRYLQPSDPLDPDIPINNLSYDKSSRKDPRINYTIPLTGSIISKRLKSAKNTGGLFNNNTKKNKSKIKPQKKYKTKHFKKKKIKKTRKTKKNN